MLGGNQPCVNERDNIRLAAGVPIRHNPQTLNNISKRFLLATVLACAASMSGQMLPAPKTPAAEGKQPPDFTLADQNGKSFHLAAMRGKRVLLIFYRGYW
jgi:hypothetical protein